MSNKVQGDQTSIGSTKICNNNLIIRPKISQTEYRNLKSGKTRRHQNSTLKTRKNHHEQDPIRDRQRGGRQVNLHNLFGVTRYIGNQTENGNKELLVDHSLTSAPHTCKIVNTQT